MFFQALSAPGNGELVWQKGRSRQEFDRNENLGPSARLVGSSQSLADDDEEQHKIGSSPAVMESLSSRSRRCGFICYAFRTTGRCCVVHSSASGRRSRLHRISFNDRVAVCTPHTHSLRSHTYTHSFTPTQQQSANRAERISFHAPKLKWSRLLSTQRRKWP